ncbi:MAG: N-acetylmuramoyl-L-alanine amidase [Patescibacteria group bacterium]
MEKTALVLLLIVTFTVSGITVISSARNVGLKSIYSRATNFAVSFTVPFTASVFFKDSVTEISLKKAYKESENSNRRKRGEKVKVLTVPGHDAQFSGTEFNGLKEVELNMELGEKLYQLLKSEPSLDVYLSQTKGGYDPRLLTYFGENRDSILEFIEKHKGVMENFVRAGEIQRVVNVKHNPAPSEMVLRLFGINKWANENGMDVVIHIHFNDYPGRRKDREEKYSGFSIYVPENQYSNAKGSKSVAKSIYQRLAKLYPQSNLAIEDDGVIEDQELIAIGANNTLDGAGMLIEYGYIYEPLFSNPSLRDTVTSDLALQTFLGIMDFFGESPTKAVGGEHQTNYVPYDWQEDLDTGNEADADVLSLQAALVLEGVYPPQGETKNDCPLSGYFGQCTKNSVKAFQEKHEISPAEGFVGEKTRAKLNELFGE